MKKISVEEAKAIAKLALKLVPDVIACIDGVTEAEALRIAGDAMALVEAVKEALKD